MTERQDKPIERHLTRRAIAGLAIFVSLVVVAAYWLTIAKPSRAECGFCKRHINERAKVVALVGDKMRRTCCAHCAITEGRQEKKPVRLISVTDYNSGEALDPAKAWFVEGSRVITCEHESAPMDMSKHPNMQMEYDRCSPATVAFATRDSADRFAAENGGSIVSLDVLLKMGGSQ